MLVPDKRQPLAAAVVKEPCDIQGTGVEQVTVTLRALGIEPLRRHELVEILERLVITGVDDSAAIARQHRCCALVLEPAERGAFPDCPIRRERIDLDDPAELERFPRICGHVETRVGVLPAISAVAAPRRQARVGPFEIGRKVCRAAISEKGVDVLLGREKRSPRRHAGCAIGERAERRRRGLDARITEQRVTAGRPGHLDRRIGRDPAVERGVEHAPPCAVVNEFDDADADRGLHVGHGPRVAPDKLAPAARRASLRPTRGTEGSGSETRD